MELDPGPGWLGKGLTGGEPGGMSWLSALSGIGADVNDNVSGEAQCDVRGCASNGSKRDVLPPELREEHHRRPHQVQTPRPDPPPRSEGAQSVEPRPRSKESVYGQVTQEHAPPGGGAESGGGSVVIGYVAGRLSEAYHHVGKHMLTTRNLVERATGAHLAGLVSQYLTAPSQEPPLTEAWRPGPQPDPGRQPDPRPPQNDSGQSPLLPAERPGILAGL